MKITLANACSDLGVHINGSEKGPLALQEIDKYVNNVITINKDNVPKELEQGNKLKNLKYVNKFNEELYNKLKDDENFVITLGGDHSIAIASDLASINKHKSIGIFWIDAHADYHTCDSTISGNIHGMPLCTIDGQNGTKLSYFHNNDYFDPKHTVIIGGRDIEKPELEILTNAGVTVFTTEDIKTLGVKEVMNRSYDIIKDCDGLHISYDLDVIDPLVAPGVSVKAKDGINEEEAYQIMDEITSRIDILKSFDLVELNPDNDIDNKTKTIALNLLKKIIYYIQKK